MKHKLKPFKEKEEKRCSTTRICFSNGKDFFKDMRCEHVYFSVILKYCKDKVDDVPIGVVDLLEKFLYIVSNNDLMDCP